MLKEGCHAPELRSPEILSLEDRLDRMFSLIHPDRDGVIKVDLLREKRVLMFYSGKTSDRLAVALLFAEVLIAMIFGGIHCIAWSFSFPTHAEQIIWHVCSVAIISIPFLFVGISLVLDGLNFNIPEFFTDLLFIFPPLIYIISRLLLLVLPFISLQSLPPSAFDIVHWTTFIPHVG
jgi:hypothetical protein